MNTFNLTILRILQLIKMQAFLSDMLLKKLLMLLVVRISSYGCTWEVWRALPNSIYAR